MGFSVLEKPATRSEGQYDGKQGTDDSIREWGIVSDTPATADQVRTFAAGLARFGDVHPFNPAKVCVGVECEHHDGSTIAFDYRATYRVPVGAGGKPKNPIDQPAKVTYDWAISEEQIDRDADGNAIIMKTGESFDPPIRRPFGDLVVTVEKNVARFDALQMGDLLFCVNSDTWLGLPPGSALLTKVSATQTIQADGSSYTTKTTSVQYRKPRPGGDPQKTWYHRQIAAGYLWKLSSILQTHLLGHTNGTDDSVFPCWTADGQIAPRPLLHDTNNGKPFVEADLSAVDYRPTLAKFYEFKIYESKPFSNAQIF